MKLYKQLRLLSSIGVGTATEELCPANLFGKIVINDESMFSVVPEVLSHSTAGVGGQVLQWGCIRRCGTHYDSVLHCI